MPTDIVRYLTHPQVQIDPDVPVPQWGLSPLGRARIEAIANAAWLSRTTQIVASGERKAIETAEILARPRGIMIEIRKPMPRERSLRHRLPAAARVRRGREPVFRGAACERSRLGARGRCAGPHRSRGRSRAARAIVRATLSSSAMAPSARCCSATMPACPIDRVHDQGPGGGHVFTFVKEGRRVLHAWRRMEEVEA